MAFGLLNDDSVILRDQPNFFSSPGVHNEKDIYHCGCIDIQQSSVR